MDKRHLKKIGALGGAARAKLHGNPGTPEGRRLGGFRSIKIHSEKATKFKTLKKIRIPRISTRLAELVGIFMGDGHVHRYQASVCTNSDTDSEHAIYIKTLIEELFSISVSIKNSSVKKACTIVVSSKRVCDFLVTQGMPQGSKIDLGLKIPPWICENGSYRRAFLRGLIDTDGCVYEDKHTVKKKVYSSTCIAFTSASPELRDFVYEALRIEGWSPTRFGKHIRLRRKNEVLAYARTIGFSNPKHTRKITI